MMYFTTKLNIYVSTCVSHTMNIKIWKLSHILIKSSKKAQPTKLEMKVFNKYTKISQKSHKNHKVALLID
jgi:hypothetical protein